MKLGKTFIVALLTVFSLSACSNGASVPGDGPGGPGGAGESGGLPPFGKICSFNEHAEGELCICNDGYELDADDNCVAGGESCNANEHAIDGDCVCDVSFKRDADDNCVADNNDEETCGSHETADASGKCVCDDGYELDSHGECAKERDPAKVEGVDISPKAIVSVLAGEEISEKFSAEPTNSSALRGKRFSYNWTLNGNLPGGVRFEQDGHANYGLVGTPEQLGLYEFSVTACITIDGSDLEPVCATTKYNLVIKNDIVLNASVRLDKNLDLDREKLCVRGYGQWGKELSPECRTTQCRAHCAEDMPDLEPNIIEDNLKIFEGTVDDRLVIALGEQLIVRASVESDELIWSVASDSDNAEIISIDEDPRAVEIISVDGNKLKNVVVTVMDDLESESELQFSSVEFKQTPPRLTLGPKEARDVVGQLHSRGHAYDDEGELYKCKGSNEAIVGMKLGTGQIGDYNWRVHVVKEIEFICADINDLDMVSEDNKPEIFHDGRWPEIASVEEFGFDKVIADGPHSFDRKRIGVATGIELGFGLVSTASVTGVGLYGASIDPRFEDNLLEAFDSPLEFIHSWMDIREVARTRGRGGRYSHWGIQPSRRPGAAMCEKGEVLTGIRGHTGVWYDGYVMFGASEILCSKVSVASE
jgi:hypothetical protein